MISELLTHFIYLINLRYFYLISRTRQYTNTVEPRSTYTTLHDQLASRASIPEHFCIVGYVKIRSKTNRYIQRKVDERVKAKHCQFMSYISKKQHGQKQG